MVKSCNIRAVSGYDMQRHRVLTNDANQRRIVSSQHQADGNTYETAGCNGPLETHAPAAAPAPLPKQVRVLWVLGKL